MLLNRVKKGPQIYSLKNVFEKQTIITREKNQYYPHENISGKNIQNKKVLVKTSGEINYEILLIYTEMHQDTFLFTVSISCLQLKVSFHCV